MRFGILDLLKVTVLSSLFALVGGPGGHRYRHLPGQYAPRAVASLSALIDLLATMPSIIGMWGLLVLGPWMVPFASGSTATSVGSSCSDGNVSIAGGSTIFTAGVVLAIMILPIITSMSRETIRQTPSLHQEPPSRWAPPSGRRSG